MDSHAGEPNFDRQSAAERYRQEWKGMKLKKKARWIKKAADNFREYDEKVTAFCTKNPGTFSDIFFLYHMLLDCFCNTRCHSTQTHLHACKNMPDCSCL